MLLFYRFPQKSTNSKYRKNVPPTLNTAKIVPPTIDTSQKAPPTLDTAQKGSVDAGYAQKVPPIQDTAQTVPASLFVLVLCSLFHLVLRVPFL